MALIDYTSYNDVRAALGVSVDEIDDATLSLDLYEFNLVSELEGISLTLIPDFLGLPPTGRTAEQTRFYQSTKLFATYATAKLGTIALPMFSPKEQTDGKAGLVRFAQDPYKATIARVLQQYEAFKSKLEVAYAAVTPAAGAVVSTRPYFSVVTPAYDPVLGG